MLHELPDRYRFDTWLGKAARARGEIWTDRRKEDFLLRAEILRTRELSTGFSGARANLSLNGVVHDAHIRTAGVADLNFRACHRYNVAAYRLDRMLNLCLAPVSVERFFEGRTGAFTWWVDDVRLTEQDRLENGVDPPQSPAWEAQVDRRRIFQDLICYHEIDAGHQLITGDWKIWLVDFTRAFRPVEELSEAGTGRVDPSLLDRLQALTRDRIDDRLNSCLTRQERRALLARRDLIVRRSERAGTRAKDPVEAH